MKRAIAYDRGQHELICRALDVSLHPDAPGCSAYEAVCVLLTKLNTAEATLKQVKTYKARRTLKILRAHHDDEMFSFLQMYGTESCKSEPLAKVTP